MTNRFMISVAAAALIAGTGFANAQGPGRDAPAAGSPVQQSAPAERAAPSAAPINRDSARNSKASDKASDKGMKSTQSDEKGARRGKNLRAQDDVKPGMKGEKSAQDTIKGEKSKSMSSETQDKGAAGKDMKADSKARPTASRRPPPRPRLRRAASRRPPPRPPLQRTASRRRPATPPLRRRPPRRLKSGRRSFPSSGRRDIPEATNVNFNISIGTAVPSTVRFYPLPPGSLKSTRSGAVIRSSNSRQVGYRSPADPYDRLHHRRLTARLAKKPRRSIGGVFLSVPSAARDSMPRGPARRCWLTHAAPEILVNEWFP